MKVNKQFNRIQTRIDNMYFPTYGENSDLSHSYSGKLKCKLLHSTDDSIIFADQIFIDIDGDEFKWIQPLTFLVNLLMEDDDIIHCGFLVDISVGRTLKIEFTNKDWVTNYADNTSLFKCKISGPPNLVKYATGTGKFIDKVPYIRLFHHTLPRYKGLIQKSEQLKLSEWNIQGTKRLTNIGYFYMTCLDEIKVDNDLLQIAMSSEGIIRLLLDNYEQPRFLDPNKATRIRQGILEIEVYRENTMNRKSTIELLVDSTIIAPKHLWKHFPKNQAVFYEVCMPFIYRIGGKKGEMLTFSNSILSRQEDIKYFDYQVVGLGTTFKGLEAPYDEENTEHIFKIEKLNNNTNILNFWFENTNSDQYSNKMINMQEFTKTPPNKG